MPMASAFRTGRIRLRMSPCRGIGVCVTRPPERLPAYVITGPGLPSRGPSVQLPVGW